MLENCYWNDNGKYQNELERLNKLTPSWGKTTNPYLDLFLVSSGLYYDVYNNGGCNIRDCYVDDIEKCIKPFADDIKGINFNCTLNTIVKNLNNEEKLEKFMDDVIEFVSDKDLSYDKYLAYFDNDKKILSYEKQESLREISFGNKEDFEDWTNHRINAWNFKVV